MRRPFLFVALFLSLIGAIPHAQARNYDDGAAAAGLSPELRNLIETTFASRFVYPETTLWYFDAVKPYFGGETLVCGHYNGQDSRKAFHGRKPFFIIISNGEIEDSGFGGEPAHDVMGALEKKLKDICFPNM